MICFLAALEYNRARRGKVIHMAVKSRLTYKMHNEEMHVVCSVTGENVY